MSYTLYTGPSQRFQGEALTEAEGGGGEVITVSILK